jgi:hypothetical protein
MAESGPSLRVQSLTSIQEKADLQHETSVRDAAKVWKEPVLTKCRNAANVCFDVHNLVF